MKKRKYENKVIYYEKGVDQVQSMIEFDLIGEEGWKLVATVGLFFFFVREKE